MVGVTVSEFEKHWQHECQCLKEEYKDIIKLHPDAADTIGQVYKVLGDIVALAGCTPASIGESEAWSHIVKTTKVDMTEFCKVLSGKQLFSALYGMYSVALNDLKRCYRPVPRECFRQQCNRGNPTLKSAKKMASKSRSVVRDAIQQKKIRKEQHREPTLR
jgi:hypothetical protein